MPPWPGFIGVALPLGVLTLPLLAEDPGTGVTGVLEADGFLETALEDLDGAAVARFTELEDLEGAAVWRLLLEDLEGAAVWRPLLEDLEGAADERL